MQARSERERTTQAYLAFTALHGERKLLTGASPYVVSAGASPFLETFRLEPNTPLNGKEFHSVFLAILTRGLCSLVSEAFHSSPEIWHNWRETGRGEAFTAPTPECWKLLPRTVVEEQ